MGPEIPPSSGTELGKAEQWQKSERNPNQLLKLILIIFLNMFWEGDGTVLAQLCCVWVQTIKNPTSALNVS